jgi:hypothetical protein
LYSCLVYKKIYTTVILPFESVWNYVHPPTEDNKEDIKGSLYEELEWVFDQFPRYHMKILLGDFKAKVGREDFFKLIIGSESLHEVSNENGIRVVNFATSKNICQEHSIPTP